MFIESWMVHKKERYGELIGYDSALARSNLNKIVDFETEKRTSFPGHCKPRIDYVKGYSKSDPNIKVSFFGIGNRGLVVFRYDDERVNKEELKLLRDSIPVEGKKNPGLVKTLGVKKGHSIFSDNRYPIRSFANR